MCVCVCVYLFGFNADFKTKRNCQNCKLFSLYTLLVICLYYVIYDEQIVFQRQVKRMDQKERM